MATSLAQQLAKIAAESKVSLNVKAQKAGHSKSLLFEPRVAAGQTFQSVFAICREGFDELCELDDRFVPFASTLFSDYSLDEDRTEMTEDENSQLDKKIESFLRLAGSKLRLLPAIKSIEWLLRRFRIHEFNTAFLLATFLPYHSMPAFVTLLSILPARLPHEFLFLQPYVRTLTAPPRAAIVQHATHHFELLSTLSTYALDTAKANLAYPGLVTFWGSLLTETVNGMLDAIRSGRITIQADNAQQLLQRVGPIMADALVTSKAPGIQVAAYMAVSLFVAKARLNDAAITAFMDQLVVGWTVDRSADKTDKTTIRAGLACLALMAQYRSAKQLSRKVTKELLRVPDLASLLLEVGRQRRIDRLVSGFVLAVIQDRIAKKAAVSRTLPLIQAILLGGLLQEKQLAAAFKALLQAAHSITDEADPTGEARKELGTALVVLSQAQAAVGGDVIRRVIADTDFDMEDLELKLDARLRPRALPESAAETADNDKNGSKNEDSAMADGTQAERETATAADMDSVLARLSALPRPASCLAGGGAADGLEQKKKADWFVAQLGQLLLSAVAAGPKQVAQLESAPLLSRKAAVSDCFYLSFCMRVWSGPYPILARAAALDMATARLSSSSDCAGTDFQALLPYCIAALADPAKKVRRAAVHLVAAVQKMLVTADEKSGSQMPWGADQLYGKQPEMGQMSMQWLSAPNRNSLLAILADSAEESVLDPGHLSTVLRDALDKSKSSSKEEEHTPKKKKKQASTHLSHSTRLALLTFLSGHVTLTPLLSVQLRLLHTLNEVRGVSGTTRTQLLLPVLQRWVALSAQEEQALVAAEEGLVTAEAVDQACVDVVVPNDKAGLECLFDVIGRHAGGRAQLLHAVFVRLRKMWPVMKEDFRLVTAQTLLEQAMKGGQTEDTEGREEEEERETSSEELVADEAAEVLQQVELSSAILGQFLEGLQMPSKMASGPASKRRRTSSSAGTNTGTNTSTGAVEVWGASSSGRAELQALLRRTTFVLQLVDGSEPALHPELLPVLFTVLADLQALRTVIGSELGYLQSVVLGCLLAIMPAYENDRRLKIDTSVGHGDVLVGCIHKSSSPAVQNTALLLVASLARTAPEVVLHSVMPIFTLMGHSVMRQGDDYSAHVVQQTVREVIPPLVETFRRSRRPVVASAADLLASFVTAYEHIPAHRRHDLFLSLVQHLGPADFLSAMVAMFADRYGSVPPLSAISASSASSALDNGSSTVLFAFLTELLGTFSAEVQLQALVQLVGLVSDIFQPRPGLSATLLGKGPVAAESDLGNTSSTSINGNNSSTMATTGSSADAAVLYPAALKELTLLPQLLVNRRLREAVGQLDAETDDMQAARLRELYVQLLEDVLTLADTVRAAGQKASAKGQPAQLQLAQMAQQMHNRCGDVLAQLLDLQSIGEFLKAVETLLDRPRLGVRQKVLRALEVRVEAEPVSSVAARTALLAFLPQLTAVIRRGVVGGTEEMMYQLTAVTCVDKIAEKYGRRDLEAVAAAAAAVAGDSCLGRDDRRLRIMALLCLASLVDVLQEAIVPVLPTALPRSLAYLESSLGSEAGPRDAELHNAVYSFITSLAQHLPYMLTGAHVDRLLASSFASAETSWDEDQKDEQAAAASKDAAVSRHHGLQLVARQVDAKTVLEAVRRSWALAVQTGAEATLELVQLVLTGAVDRSGKSAIVKNLPTLSALLQAALDLRRQARMEEGEETLARGRKPAAPASQKTKINPKTKPAAVAPSLRPRIDAIELAVYTAALHMVYKLNDAAFRPVFADLMAWCDGGLPQLDVLGRCLRQQAVYGFLLIFFGRLQSAVTTYAAYITDGATAALRSARVATSTDDRQLWARVLQTLAACFAHDQSDNGGSGGYWQVPAHFAAVAPVIVEQFGRVRDLQRAAKTADSTSSRLDASADLLLTEALVPAVVQLAKAAHSAEHHKELNGLLLKRLRSSHAAERLAVVRCQQALTEEVGEEWLAMLPEMLPYMSELQDDDDETVDRETHRWINKIETVLGESLDSMLQ